MSYFEEVRRAFYHFAHEAKGLSKLIKRGFSKEERGWRLASEPVSRGFQGAESRPAELEAFLEALDGPQPEGFAQRLFKAQDLSLDLS